MPQRSRQALPRQTSAKPLVNLRLSRSVNTMWQVPAFVEGRQHRRFNFDLVLALFSTLVNIYINKRSAPHEPDSS
jgi:hypothetical protein